jgi:S-adenosylmethionine hydrolase
MSFLRILLITAILFFIAILPIHAKDMIVKEPPKSLSKYYPPESKKSQWIQQMHKMSTHFGGVFINLKEKDYKNVDMHADKLVEEYKKTSEMVPEWEDYFDIKAAEAFAAAAKNHDIAQVGKVSVGLGKTCGKCHAEQEVSVWAKFHWPSFHKIKVTDPISEKEIEFGDYMGSISSSFKGVTVNFGEGQYDRAKKALKVFKSRYMELKSTCSKCHATQDVKHFYVGEDTDTAFAGLSHELNSKKPNQERFWKNIDLLGKTGCKHCHLVHRSNSFIKEMWKK